MSEENKEVSIKLNFSDIEHLKLFFKSFSPNLETLKHLEKELTSKLSYIHYMNESRRYEDVKLTVGQYRKELQSVVENCINYIETLESFCDTMSKK